MVPRHVRCHILPTQRLHQFLLVVAFVSAQRHAPLAAHFFRHLQRRRALRRSRRFRQPRFHNQPVAVFHQHVSRVTQLGFLALTLLRQPRVGIRRGLMRFVRPLLPVKVHRRIAAALRRRFALSVLAFETLRARPRLQQRPVHREVLVTQQILLAQLRHHPLEKHTRHIAFQQTLAVLAEYRGHPHRLIHVQPHKPAEQQVVIKLLHQQPLAAHRVQHLQQQGPQQLLRRDRRPPVRRVESRKFRRQLLQHGIHDLANRPQRMFLRHSLLRRNVAVHRSLLLIFSAHAILLKSLRRARARFRVTPCRTFSATC